MKIRIKETGHRAITIRLPNLLMTIPPVIKWLNKKCNIQLNRQQVKEIYKTLNKFKKENKQFVLVDITTSDEEVQILW